MKRLLTTIIALTLAAALLLAGCSMGGKPVTVAQVKELLSNDFEVEYVFSLASLPVNSRQPVKDADQTLYYLVDSEKYKTLADLKKLLEATYATPETVDLLLGTQDQNGRPLYTDLDGKLHRSASPQLNAMGSELDNASITLLEGSKDSVPFTVLENTSDGGQAKLTMTAVKTKNGWRLSGPRTAGEREQLKASPGQAVESGGLAATAQRFLDALKAKDADTLKQLTDDMGGMTGIPLEYDYGFLAESGVTDAKLTQTVREDEYQGEYQVELTVSSGNGTFPDGQSRYRLTVGTAYGGAETQVVVESLWQEGQEPYEWLPNDQQTNRAIDQLLRLRQIAGAIQFTDPTQIPAGTMTEFALYELTAANPDQTENGFALEEVQKQVLKLFGVNDFQPAQDFFSPETDSYLFYGRGGVSTNSRLVQIQEGDGLVIIEARHYSDPLQLRSNATIVYTMKNNWNGTYEFVSGILKTE